MTVNTGSGPHNTFWRGFGLFFFRGGRGHAPVGRGTNIWLAERNLKFGLKSSEAQLCAGQCCAVSNQSYELWLRLTLQTYG